MNTETLPSSAPRPAIIPARSAASATGQPREFFGNRFVYAVISARARGLAIGVNMNPDRHCNFDCEYCEVNRKQPVRETILDLEVMAEELQRMLAQAHSGELQRSELYHSTPADLMRLRHVTLSGDGEPTLCPNFLQAVETVVHVRALGKYPFFKIVLVTNATGLDLPEVQDGLKLFMPQDEIWAKLEAGTQQYMEAVNHPDCSLEKIVSNILTIARHRPVIIQSLFPLINGQEPPAEEIEQYAQRLAELKRAGAQIPLVQIYSATRPMVHSHCGHLPLRTLARIAQTVKKISGLNAEVF